MTFIFNSNNKLEINHKDGNKTNNIVTNLEYCTHNENIKHSWDNGLQIVTDKRKECGKKNAKLNFYDRSIKLRKKVIQYDLNGIFVKEWESMHEVERQLKINNSHISACCKGKRKTAGGYIWMYKEGC